MSQQVHRVRGQHRVIGHDENGVRVAPGGNGDAAVPLFLHPLPDLGAVLDFVQIRADPDERQSGFSRGADLGSERTGELRVLLGGLVRSSTPRRSGCPWSE